MAAPVYCLRTVIRGCQRHILKQTGICSPSSFTSTNGGWAATRFYVIPAGIKIRGKKFKKEEKPKHKLEQNKDTNHIKPFGLTTRKPVDDVYVARYYANPVFEPEVAVEMLKTFQELDLSSPDQAMYIHLTLDMKVEKKKKVDPFVGYVHFPFPFIKEKNKVLVFTEKPEQMEIAKNAGAAIVGGNELIPGILNDDIQADFYLATTEVISQLNILKNKLRKKFPKNKRGSVGNDIANMVKLFEHCFEYEVEEECIVRSKIATLDMPLEHAVANMEALIKDVCKHRPLNLGPFIQSAILASATSEELCIDVQKFLPKESIETEED